MVCTRRSANLRNLLYKRKAFSLSVPGENKSTSQCGVKRCLSCKLVNPITTVTSTTTGNCYRINCNATCICRCLVYLAECTVCKKQYVGNTTQPNNCVTALLDTETTRSRLHLVLHGINFNQAFKFVVLSKTSPEKLTELESMWISKLRTSEPNGLNRVDPCALRTASLRHTYLVPSCTLYCTSISCYCYIVAIQNL